MPNGVKRTLQVDAEHTHRSPGSQLASDESCRAEQLVRAGLAWYKAILLGQENLVVLNRQPQPVQDKPFKQLSKAGE